MAQTSFILAGFGGQGLLKSLGFQVMVLKCVVAPATVAFVFRIRLLAARS